MVPEESDPFDKEDQRFRERLAARDRTVLIEISETYKSPIMGLLLQQLQRADAEEAFNEALLNLWQDYRGDAGSSVRHFLGFVAKRRMIETINKRTRQRRLADQILRFPDVNDAVDSRTAERAMLSREDQVEVDALLMRIDSAMTKLNPKQQLAIRRRFLESSDKKWAKKLEAETQVPAKEWRKHSDSGIKKIQKIVSQNEQDKAGEERHDVA